MKSLFFLMCVLALMGCIPVSPNSMTTPTATTPMDTPSTEDPSLEEELGSALPESIRPNSPVATSGNGGGYLGGESGVTLQCFQVSGKEPSKILLEAWKESDSNRSLVYLFSENTFESFESEYDEGAETVRLQFKNAELTVYKNSYLVDRNQYPGVLQGPEQKEILYCSLNTSLDLSNFTTLLETSQTSNSQILSAAQAEVFEKRGSHFWYAGRVPFEISPDVPNPSLILAAMRKFEMTTPIRFVPRTAGNSAYAHFMNTTSTVSSAPLGRKSQGENPVFISIYASLADVLHELGHVVGMIHQVWRLSFPHYVTVLFENMLPRFRAEFDLAYSRKTNSELKFVEGQIKGRGVDTNSIMMHTRFAYTSNGLPTLESTLKDGGVVIPTTPAAKLSDGDKGVVGALITRTGCAGESSNYQISVNDESPYELRTIFLTYYSQLKNTVEDTIEVRVGPTEKPLILYLSSTQRTNIAFKFEEGANTHSIILTPNLIVSPKGDRPMGNLLVDSKTPIVPAKSAFWTQPERARLQVASYKDYLRTLRANIQALIPGSPKVEVSTQACKGRAFSFYVPNTAQVTFSSEQAE